MSEMQKYFEERLRRPPPKDLSIVFGSTPVLSFGSLKTARIATLGLNPSRVEFLDRDGRELAASQRRLATHTSLSTNDLTQAPSSVLQRIVDDCESYFHRNPYRRWFDQLERILTACSASYYDGSACHLDLVQWATDPTWGGLSKRVQTILLAADAPFLFHQLQTEHLRILLVNGMGVIKQLEATLNFQLVEEPPVIKGQCKSRIFSAMALGRVFIVGWSINLQSSSGVTSEFKSTLANRVSLLAHGYIPDSEPISLM